MSDKTAFTKRNYVNHTVEFLHYLKERGVDINNESAYKSIKYSDINQYMEEHVRFRVVDGIKKENKESIRASKLYSLTNFFEFLISEEYIEKNPCDRVKPPHCTEEKPIVAMDRNDINKLKANIVTGAKFNSRRQKFVNRDLAIVDLGCSTGLRVTSIIEINISDINFDENYIVVREKGNKERVVYMGAKVKEQITKWIGDRNSLYPRLNTDALFVSEKKQRLSTRTVRDIINNNSMGIDKHITPHKMRSSCATNLYEQTGDIYLVQAVLGHKNIANTRRYARMSDNKRMEAANIMDSLL